VGRKFKIIPSPREAWIFRFLLPLWEKVRMRGKKPGRGEKENRMNKPIEKILEELKERISQVVEIKDMRLFGSRARGDFSIDSDMDVFIEVSEINKDLKERLADIGWEIGLENEIYISLLIFTENELKNTPLKASSIVQNIMQEGRRI